MAKQAKTYILHVRIRPDDRKAIEKAAARAGMGMSEYARACTLTIMLAGLDPHAVKMVGAGLADAAGSVLRKLTIRRRIAA